MNQNNIKSDGPLGNDMDNEIRKIFQMLKNKEISSKEAYKKIDMIKNSSMNKSNISELLYYEYNWEQTKAINTKKEGLNNLIIFDLDSSLEKEIYKLVDEKTTSIILVKTGEKFKKSSHNTYEINPEKADDYINLFQELISNEFYPEKILHLWTKNNNLSYKHIEGQADELLNLGAYSLFYIINTIFKLEIRSLRRFMVVTNNSKENNNPVDSCIKGFTPSITKIMPKLVFSTLEIPFNKLRNEEASNIVLNELSYKEGLVDLNIKYDETKRYVKKINRMNIDNNNTVKIKNQGVYLITGGAGGLGLMFSRYLAEKYNAKLVLTGRSSLNDKRKEIINEIEKSGGEVLYLQADVGNKEAMENVINIVKEKYGYINGIIHTSGLHSDRVIIEKDFDEFKNVLWPKVEGTLVLDEVTKEEEMDFMLMFSSTSSVIGDFGQGDYAVANKFLDEFVTYREDLRKENKRKGITKAINWPLWKEGGMHFDEKSEALYLQTSGMTYLENSHGFEVFENVLSSKKEEVIVFSGDSNKIQRIIDVENDGREIAKDRKASNNNTSNFKSHAQKGLSLDKKIEYDILKITSDIVKIDINRLDLDENIGSFGFDSIGLKEFADKLSQFYDIDILPIIFFDKSTLRELINYFSTELREKLQEMYNEDQEEVIEVSNNIIKNEEKNTSVIEEKRELKIENSKTEIAIIGISGRFPGSKDVEDFWNNMEYKKNLIKEIPIDRWNWRDYFYETDNYPRWCGFIEDVDKFDARFFNLSRREAEYMDPKQRLLIESAWESMEDSGYKASYYAGKKVGVFIGAQANEYQELFGEDEGTLAQHVTGNSNSLLANRLSFIFNFKGPSETIDTACSSSLVAIHRAVKSIQSGESELAIAGGISLILSPSAFMGTINLGVLSPDGKCKTFDKSANGYVKGEGLGTVILKPLNKAIEDKDNIYGVIKGTAEGHGGKANSLTAPNSDAQAELLISAYRDAGINPETLTYYEAHGTGTELGDPVEIEGIKKALVTNHTKTNDKYCAIGSVKTNIGHLEPASGIAGFIKVIMCMKHEKLLGILNFNELNPYIKLEGTPFYIIEKSKPWDRIKDEFGNVIPRRAGISSFGFGGTNAHIVLEEYKEEENIINNDQPQIITLSAANEERLKEYAAKMIKFIDNKFNKRDVKDQQIVKRIEDDLLVIVSEIINVSIEEIDSYENVDKYGFDQILVARLSEIIDKKYNLDNSISLFGKYISISDMAKELLGTYEDIMTKYYIDDFYKASQKSNMNIEEIAYTLQFGREEMDTRLAFVADDINDLKEKLFSYINDKNDFEDIFTGKIQSSKVRRKAIVEGEEGRIFIKALIEGRKLDKIARIWVSGGEVDWNELHNNKRIKKITLPTYPFAKERYWVSENNKEKSTLIHSKLHPMIDKNTSSLEVQQFTTMLDGKEFYITDTMNGKRISNVAYIEMARAAGELSCHNKITTIKDIVWIKPILVEENLEIKIELFKEDDSVEYDVITIDEKSTRVVHSQGKLLSNPVNKNECINIETIKNKCSKKISRELCYEKYKELGFNYEDGLKAIQKIYAGEEEVLAILEVPNKQKNNDFILHPTLMDGALQAIIGLAHDGDETTYVPFALEEVTILGNVKDIYYAYVVFKGATSDTRKFNVDLLDKDGNIIVSIKEYLMRALYPTKKIIKNPIKNKESLSSELEKDILLIASDILRMNEEEIEMDIELNEFGFDSITYTEFSNRLNEKYNISTIPSVFYEYATLKSFMEYLTKEYKEILSSFYSNNISDVSSDLLEQEELIKDLSKNKDIEYIDTKQYVKERSGRGNKSNNSVKDDIAIIGVSGRYPMADNLDEFWNNLITSRDCVTEIPMERWDYNRYYDPEKQKPGKSYCKWGGFLDQVDTFDPLFFKISPLEAKFMDPQERLFLETVWHTMEDSGYCKSRIGDNKVGVFVGVMYGEYQLYGAQEDVKGNPVSLSSSFSSIANRVSYFYDFKGPSIALDTMCSSAITAVHLACESLYRNETDMAIAGGVNVTIHPNKYLMLSQNGMASSDGKCHSYGDGGDGYVPGEGTGAILLKPLKKAKEDGDYIYGVIKGLSVHHGGKSNGYTVPNPSAQADVIQETLNKTKIDPRTISYIEGQGTGTTLGDSIEIGALTKTFTKYTNGKQYCPIGSVKSNIGHLESAGGIAAITKVLLQMKYKKLVPSINSDVLNPNINFNDSPFYVQHEVSDWEQPVIDGQKYPRRAGINAFGAGGLNSYMIIEEFENESVSHDIDTKEDNIVVLSARNGDRLKALVKDLYEYLEKNKEEVHINDVAYTLQISREAMDERLAIIASSTEDLIVKLKDYYNNNESDKIFKGNSRKDKLELNALLKQKDNNYIKTIISNTELFEIAQLWVKGGHIEWKSLENNQKCNLITLPNYPFAKQRYWISISDDNTKVIVNNKVTKEDISKNNNLLDDNKVIQEDIIEINDELDDSRKEEIYQEVLSNVKRYMSELLSIDDNELELDIDIYDYGMNSILLIQLANKIKNDYDNLSSYGSIFTDNTIEGIAKNICKDIFENNSVKKKKDTVKRKIVKNEAPVEKLDGSDLVTDNIFINGVTGLLGGRTVKEYLESTNSKLYCLVRGDNEVNAKNRIWDIIKVFDPEEKIKLQFEQRVIPILGDISLPKLGLEDDVYNELASKIDMVLHIAAKISLHGFYHEVKAVNVDGTRNMIDFALKTKQKYFIHTSTIAIVGNRLFKNCPPFTEEDYDLGQEFDKMGYEQSKFEAEQMVRSASKDGLKWIINRAGYIMGDSNEGYYPFGLTSVPGVFYDYIKTAIEMKVFFDSPFYFDVTPVNYISSAIVHLTTQNKNIYEVYHLCNPHPTTLNDIMKCVIKYGFEVDIINFNKFFDILESDDNEYRSLATELMLLNFEEADSFGYSSVDASYTKEILEKAGITCPKVNEKLINTYLDYCIEKGYLNKLNENKDN